jgi:hypothetical protein
MRAAVRWLMKYVALLGVLALPGAGCSQENNNTAETTTSLSPATARPGPFLAEVRAMTFGTKDLSAASDGELLRLGKVVCDGLGIKGLGARRVIQRLVQSQARPTSIAATAFVRSAARNLCPNMPARSVDGAVHARCTRDRQAGREVDSVVTEDRPRPHRELGAVVATASFVALAGRATHVPHATTTSGIQQTTTVTQRRPLGWMLATDPGD